MDWWCANHWKGMVFVCLFLAREFLALISSFQVANPRDGRVTHCGQPREAFWSVDTEVQVSVCDAGVFEYQEGRVLFASKNVWCAGPPTFDCRKGVVPPMALHAIGAAMWRSACGSRPREPRHKTGFIAEASLRHAIALWRPTATICLPALLGFGSARTARRRHQRRLEIGAVTEMLSSRAGERNTGPSGRLLI